MSLHLPQTPGFHYLEKWTHNSSTWPVRAISFLNTCANKSCVSNFIFHLLKHWAFPVKIRTPTLRISIFLKRLFPDVRAQKYPIPMDFRVKTWKFLKNPLDIWYPRLYMEEGPPGCPISSTIYLKGTPWISVLTLNWLIPWMSDILKVGGTDFNWKSPIVIDIFPNIDWSINCLYGASQRWTWRAWN